MLNKLNVFISIDICFLKKLGDRFIIKSDTKRREKKERPRSGKYSHSNNMTYFISSQIISLRKQGDIVVVCRCTKSKDYYLKKMREYYRNNTDKCKKLKRKIEIEKKGLGLRFLSKFLKETK